MFRDCDLSPLDIQWQTDSRAALSRREREVRGRGQPRRGAPEGLFMSTRIMDGQGVRYAARRGVYATSALWVVTALLLLTAFRVSQSAMDPL